MLNDKGERQTTRSREERGLVQTHQIVHWLCQHATFLALLSCRQKAAIGPKCKAPSDCHCWKSMLAPRMTRNLLMYSMIMFAPSHKSYFFPSSSPYKPRHLKSTSEGALAFCYRFLPQTSTLCSKALQHNGQDAVLQRGFVFTGFEATLRLIPAEFLHPDSLRLPGQQGK